MMSGCWDVTSATEDNDQEVITTAELTFSPTTGDDQVFSWADPENDGDPIIDQLTDAAAEYALGIRFLNELENPVEDVTPEMDEEFDQHQVFFTARQLCLVWWAWSTTTTT
ncbi:MAG: hypothetical protein H6735_13710 [Alphaproteobacteria bacterium]|nr:hypothetical protein [Alphaproteobacteria bacterium]